MALEIVLFFRFPNSASGLNRVFFGSYRWELVRTWLGAEPEKVSSRPEIVLKVGWAAGDLPAIAGYFSHAAVGRIRDFIYFYIKI